SGGKRYRALGSAMDVTPVCYNSFPETFPAAPGAHYTFTLSARRSAAKNESAKTMTHPGTVSDGSSSAMLLMYPFTDFAAESSIETTLDPKRVGGDFGRA